MNRRRQNRLRTFGRGAFANSPAHHNEVVAIIKDLRRSGARAVTITTTGRTYRG